MDKLEKIMTGDILRTIIQIADDCLYELESEDYEKNIDEVDTLFEIKIGRIQDEINSFKSIIMDDK